MLKVTRIPTLVLKESLPIEACVHNKGGVYVTKSRILSEFEADVDELYAYWSLSDEIKETLTIRHVIDIKPKDPNTLSKMFNRSDFLVFLHHKRRNFISCHNFAKLLPYAMYLDSIILDVYNHEIKDFPLRKVSGELVWSKKLPIGTKRKVLIQLLLKLVIERRSFDLDHFSVYARSLINPIDIDYCHNTKFNTRVVKIDHGKVTVKQW